MNRIINYIIIVIFIILSNLSAQKVTPRQYFFTVKKIFPDTEEIGVFIQSSELPEVKDKIALAAAQAQIKVKIYSVSDFKSIGKGLKKLPQSGTIVVYPSPILLDKSSKLFVLKKCKEKAVAVISESKEYSDAGALLGIFPQVGAKTKIILNLKHSQDLLAKFTPDYVKQVGISEVIH